MFLATLARYLGQIAGKKKIGCVSCLALLLVVVACAVLLCIARGCVIPVQGKGAQIFMCHVAKKISEAGMQQCKNEFLQQILEGIRIFCEFNFRSQHWCLHAHCGDRHPMVTCPLECMVHDVS